MKKIFTLAEGATHVNNFSGRRKIAFTLAEVLITLGIIGVVAAMTMPTLIQNHQKQTYVTGFKKGVSVIDNMFKKMQADEGVSSFWDTELSSQGNCYIDGSETCEDWYGNPSVFERIIPKYIKTVKICRGADCNVKYAYSNNVTLDSNGDIQKVDYSNLTKDKNIGTVMRLAPFYYITENAILGFYTNDGAIYYITPGGSFHGALNAIESNGEKGPNQLGRDLIGYVYIGGKPYFEGLAWPHYYAKNIVQSGWKMNY